MSIHLKLWIALARHTFKWVKIVFFIYKGYPFTIRSFDIIIIMFMHGCLKVIFIDPQMEIKVIVPILSRLYETTMY